MRLRILAMVTATPVSAAEVASVTGLAHAAASYHLRQLAESGLVDRLAIEPEPGRKGRPMQRYRMREHAFEDLGPDSAQPLRRGLLSELDRRLEAAGRNSRTTDAEVWLADGDWRRVIALVQEAGEIVHRRALPPHTRRSKHVGFTSLLLELR
jgi:predicted ArsR family transcriptional regulator